MSFAVVIPARYASSRLPGKPLLEIAGKPMLQRVWERAMQAGAAQVIVATDDARIESACRQFGAEVVMTSADHPSGTDRLQEVAQQRAWEQQQIVVNVQGDEPLIPPALIRQVAENLARYQEASIATLCVPVTEREELVNPNAVKVVADHTGLALYFSRATIPWPRDAFAAGDAAMPDGAWFRHIGIYAYRAGFLHRYVNWPPAPPEQLERLEQLRALYNGERIHVAAASEPVPPGVDTQADLDAVRALLEGDSNA